MDINEILPRSNSDNRNNHPTGPSLKMDVLMIRLSLQIKELEKTIQPYRWSNASAEKIKGIFAEMNNIMDDAELWMKHNVDKPSISFVGKPYKEIKQEEYVKDMLKCRDEPFPREAPEEEPKGRGRPKGSKNKRLVMKATELHFPVPDMDRPNFGMWEGCSAYYIDRLTKFYLEKEQEKANEAIYGLLDIGKAFDRELDPNTNPEDMLVNEDLRADSAKADYWRKLKYPDDTPEPVTKVAKLKTIINTLSGIHEPNIEVDVDAERAEAFKLLSEYEIP